MFLSLFVVVVCSHVLYVDIFLFLMSPFFITLTHIVLFQCFVLFFFKQKTAYEMRISDWSSDVCSSDLCVPFESGLSKGTQRSSPYQRCTLRQSSSSGP